MPAHQHTAQPPDHPPSDTQALSVRDTQILDLLRSGAPIRRATEIGAYRGTWTRDDVLRVAAHMARQPDPQPAHPPRRKQQPPVPVVLPEWHPPVPDREPADVILSSLQAGVLTALCCCATTWEIRHQFDLTDDELKTVLRGLFRRLQVENRAQAVAVALTGCARVTVIPEQRRRRTA